MIVYCKPMTWVGTSVSWAEHYYGDLICGKKRKELTHALTASGAARMTRREGDGTTWVVGEKTNRFSDKEHVKQEAIRQYKTAFPGATILVYGGTGVCDPQPILDGPEYIKVTANRFVDRANEVGWWEGDEDDMQVICDEWDEFWKGIKCSHLPLN